MLPICLLRRPGRSPLRTLHSSAALKNAPETQSPPQLKRFWKRVDIVSHNDNNLAVALDGRPLKTPFGTKLSIPKHKRLLATLIAGEWDNQEIIVKPHALSLTSLVSRALEFTDDKEVLRKVKNELIAYLDTDTVCFYADAPEPLVARQTKHWDPLITWMNNTFGVELRIFRSVLDHSQPNQVKTKLQEALDSLDEWEMAAMERATMTTKSFIIALALLKGHITVEDASDAARVEVLSQIDRWGAVEDTHDVDFYDIRRQLASTRVFLSNV